MVAWGRRRCHDLQRGTPWHQESLIWVGVGSYGCAHCVLHIFKSPNLAMPLTFYSWGVPPLSIKLRLPEDGLWASAGS